MLKLLYFLKQKIGINGAIAYSGGARIIQGFTGVASVFFISTFLTGVEQGFYYTFGSILALQVFFELGLTGIMTQFVAHEASHLSLNNENKYQGDSRYKSRLASLLQFCVKWYAILAIVVFVFLLITGYYYFKYYGKDNSDVNWESPWFMICVGTAIKLFQSPFNSILLGLGKVKEMSKIGFWQQIIIPSTVWIGLVCGLKLYVVGVSYLVSVSIWHLYVCKTKLITIVLNLWKENLSERVSYVKEIFPYQWKIALSWVSGYFIFQLFNPVLFATEGAVVAGQMGMTLTALNAISSLSMSWLNTKIPIYSQLIALKKYYALDSIHKRTQKQMICVCCSLLVFFLFCVFLLQHTEFTIGGNVLAERFLNLLLVAIMCLPVMTNLIINSWAVYLRCHKDEPYLVISIVNGAFCMGSTIILGYFFGLYGITLGYCFIQLCLIPWYYCIFKNKKVEWHE